MRAPTSSQLPTFTSGAVSGTTAGACPWCGTRTPDDEPSDDPLLVTSPEHAADIVVPLLGQRDREACVALVLNTRHAVLAVEVVSIGSLDHTFMAPREVFRLALHHNAAALIVAHNHPSGDATPSDDDRDVTTRLVRAGQLLGVTLLDHLVVGGTSWQSLARHGHL